MAIHFRCQDARGRPITCEKENWDGHIAAKHKEVNEQEAAVVLTLEKPLAIYQDARDLNRQVYYRPGALPGPFAKYYLRVVVEFRQRMFGTSQGYVVTAFAVSQADAPKKGEVIIWSP